MKNKIRLSRITGVLLVLLIGTSSGLTVSGSISGDVCPQRDQIGSFVPFTVTVTPIAPSTGGGTNKSIVQYYSFDNLSLGFFGVIKPTGFGYSFSPIKVDLNEGLVQDTVVNFTVQDTMKPSLHILNLKDTTINIGQSITIKMEAADNSMILSGFYYDYSIDSGKTWTKIGEEIKTAPEFFLTGYERLSGKFYLPHQYSFTPQVINNNYMLRVIIEDYFKHSPKDTQTTVFKVIPSTKILVNKFTPTNKFIQKRCFVDLKGRQISNKKASTIYFNMSRPKGILNLK
jgi:hypothetical protein